MAKAELKTKLTKASATAYIAGLKDKQQQADSRVLLALMQKATGEKPRMWGASLIGFGQKIYHYSTGREVEWLKVGFAPRKDSLSLYLTCDLDEFDVILKKLGKYKRGVGCLYIKRLSDVDMKVLSKLIAGAIKNAPVAK